MIIVENLKTKKERVIYFVARNYNQYRDSTKIKKYKNHCNKKTKKKILS
jgi:hypothetical protein